MWRELPKDTLWHEAEINQDDLKRIRVFPRAQWRRVANGSFLLKDIVKRIRTMPFGGRTRDFGGGGGSGCSRTPGENVSTGVDRSSTAPDPIATRMTGRPQSKPGAGTFARSGSVFSRGNVNVDHMPP